MHQRVKIIFIFKITFNYFNQGAEKDLHFSCSFNILLNPKVINLSKKKKKSWTLLLNSTFMLDEILADDVIYTHRAFAQSDWLIAALRTQKASTETQNL